MFRIKIALLVGGVALAFFGVQEWRLAQAAKETPQTITCADLEAKGPGDNAHIVLTDFIPCDQIVYETNKNSKTWSKVYVPVISKVEFENMVKGLVDEEGKLKGPIPTPQNIKVIVKSGKVSGEGELGMINGQLPGLVINKIASLGGKERKLLEESYPGTNLETCYIVEHDRKPAGMGQIAGLTGGGVVLALLGVGLLLGGNRGGNKG